MLLAVLSVAAGLSGWERDAALEATPRLTGCDLRRVDGRGLSAERLSELSGEEPLVIENLPLSRATALWEKESAVSRWGAVEVALRRDNVAQFPERTTLAEAVEGWRGTDAMVIDFEGISSGGLFQETNKLSGGEFSHVVSEHIGESGDTISLGPTRAGAGFHTHPQTWLALLHGKKRWFFYSPGAYQRLPDKVRRLIAVQEVTPAAILDELERLPQEHKPLECTQAAGEVMYFPHVWLHGTMNIGEAVGFGSQQRVSPDHGYYGPILRRHPDAVEALLYQFHDQRREIGKEVGQAELVRRWRALAENLAGTFPLRLGYVRTCAKMHVESGRPSDAYATVSASWALVDRLYKKGRITRQQASAVTCDVAEIAVECRLHEGTYAASVRKRLRQAVELWDGYHRLPWLQQRLVPEHRTGERLELVQRAAGLLKERTGAAGPKALRDAAAEYAEAERRLLASQGEL